MPEYQAIVLGAGPAGIAVVGNLLNENVKPILWIDDEFQGGRLNAKYREVPSNTRVCLFRDFATAIPPLKKIVDTTPKPNAFTVLEEMDGESRCMIAEAADLCQMLIDGLDSKAGVIKIQGDVTSFKWIESTKHWSVQAIPDTCDSEKDMAISKMVVLCHGSSPSPPPFPIPIPNLQELNLDPALKPSELTNLLPKDDHVTIAVVGASHSAILVLRNLYNLATTTHPKLRVKWFTRHPLRYAIPQPEGWTLRDNTGLKGVAATFARENLEDDKLPTSLGGKYITKIHTTVSNQEEIYKREMVGCTHIIQAIGYTQDPFPPLIMDGKALEQDELRVNYDYQSGRLRDSKREWVPGMFGAGIAWPERTTDPLGNVEWSVGMWKFMKYLKAVVPDWVSSAVDGKA